MTEQLKKKTDELLAELKLKNLDIQDYIDENKNSFIEISLNQFWNELLERSGKSKSNIINDADISYIYFYEILQGKKIPKKDKIIRLILAMELELEDAQNALKYCNQSPLYPRIKRDSLLIYAVENHYSIFQTQQLLIENGETELQ
ncbi:MAG: hypothetical protein IKE65_10445 [Clostridia bacterium]|nr:hypothetical protein [Clostridia bacterium]